MKKNSLRAILLSCILVGLSRCTLAFLSPRVCGSHASAGSKTTVRQQQQQQRPLQASVSIDTELTDDKVTELFAWISRAFAGDEEYNNLMLAIAVIFGDLVTENAHTETAQMALRMKEKALSMLENNSNNNNTADLEERLTGEPFSTDDREISSLGAMGAAQWTGNFKTRPHALLDISNFTCVDDWVQTLPRGCKRTLKRALKLQQEGNWTVAHKPIVGQQPAPHSALAHFRCVIAHEVRLLTYNEQDVQGFLDALAEGVSRYMGTTRMAGDIYEYRRREEEPNDHDENDTKTNANIGKGDGTVIAIAHEVRKGQVIRGQWFYANEYASQNYVWFHSVYSLVDRAIRENQKQEQENEKENGSNKVGSNRIAVVDLGPSGSDSFSQLKNKYGFRSVDDWTRAADYRGPFHYVHGRPKDGTDLPAQYEQQLQDQAQLRSFF